ncbi:NAD(P)-binding domain-containing protein, partial [Bordetella bronchiseptica]|uniref:NAD(P)-binding domain-containing protein n=3 Tax=Bordetella bronchiseptica TaxID=518 RepID=UPI00352AFE21
MEAGAHADSMGASRAKDIFARRCSPGSQGRGAGVRAGPPRRASWRKIHSLVLKTRLRRPCRAGYAATLGIVPRRRAAHAALIASNNGDKTMSDAAPMRIGFIGLGAMGGPICGHLAAAGHDVAAYDIQPAAVQAAAARGARPAASV